jgi:Mg-chelatase subunit ChlD
MSAHADPPDPARHPSLRRWRLALGQFADEACGACGGLDARMDLALDRCYGNAYRARGVRRSGGAKGPGSLDPSQLAVLDWLAEVRRLFPASVCETIQAHAVDEYGMSDILTDPAALLALQPNVDLLRALITLKGRANPALTGAIRQVARQVVDDILRRLRTEMQRALSGARRRRASAARRSAADLDWRATVRDNLKNWNVERQALIAERLRFHGRTKRRFPWTIVLCVDQSGSMALSVIHAAVMAAILSSLPAVSVRLVVFDTSVVDLTGQAADPVDVLMAVQLGGGTQIGQALEYCEQRHITQPNRTILVLLSDFAEGGSPARMVAAVRRMAGARVTLLGLAALDDEARPDYDRGMAQLLATAGMHVAALTPERFAEWVADRIA